MTNEEIRNRLFELKDEKYKEFTLKLIPGLEPDNVIGVRTPKVAQLTKEIIKSGDYSSFLDDYPHKYYEEMGIHVAIINSMKNSSEGLNTELNNILDSIKDKKGMETLTELIDIVQGKNV